MLPSSNLSLSVGGLSVSSPRHPSAHKKSLPYSDIKMWFSSISIEGKLNLIFAHICELTI